MTMTTKRIRGCALAVALTTTALATAAATSDIGARASEPRTAVASQALAPAWTLTGTWIVTVTRENPPPTVQPTFQSLMTFTGSGGMIETSNTGTALRGPAHGAWIRTGQRRFVTNMVFFRFNPATGAFLGTQQVHRKMRLSRDQMSFTATSVADQYNPDGSLALGGLRATETGTLVTAQPAVEAHIETHR